MGTYDQRAGSGSRPRLTKPALNKRSQRAVHRRRRLIALAGAGVFLLFLLVATSGGSTLTGADRPGDNARPKLADNVADARSAEQARENAAITRTLAVTPFVRIAGAQHREIALTFDDGPGPFTGQVLSVLQQAHVPATFFEVGVLERYFHDATAAIVNAGDVIGDHTYAHAPMSHLSKSDQRTQLLQDTSTIGQFGAPFPRLFRPPYGLFNATTLALLRQFKMLMVMWTVDTEDYRLPGVDAIVQSAVGGARPGAIILLHDAGGNRAETVAALPQIITRLRAKGYTLVTVPRLLADNPAPANQDLNALAGSGG